jgi:hypothetical protein
VFFDNPTQANVNALNQSVYVATEGMIGPLPIWKFT